MVQVDPLPMGHSLMQLDVLRFENMQFFMAFSQLLLELAVCAVLPFNDSFQVNYVVFEIFRIVFVADVKWLNLLGI